MQCSICLNADYSLKVIIEYENCTGCGTLICLDCFDPTQPCMICKSYIKKFVINQSVDVCDEMDEKYGKFKCFDCNSEIPRKKYTTHLKSHAYTCECEPKCVMDKVTCENFVFTCKIKKHLDECARCRGRYCLHCAKLYTDGPHYKVRCICDEAYNIFCKTANTYTYHNKTKCAICQSCSYRRYNYKDEWLNYFRYFYLGMAFVTLWNSKK